jgi:chemotaxis protein methyltransferase CheR
MPIDPKDFEFISTLVLKRSAIVLDKEKTYLVESRLQPIARQNGLSSISDLVNKLRSAPTRELIQQVVEAMTTNETSFFRDVNPFDALKQVVLPDLLTKRAAEKKINIWCGASSTGQEPYTIAMVLSEFFATKPDWKYHILSTDLSTEVLEKARSGVYTQLEVNRGLPASYLVKYFQRQGNSWHVKDCLKKVCDFRQLNLIDTSWCIPTVDIVFMRNVLIYFDVPTKKNIFKKIRQVLKPDGFLFLGGAETTMNLDDSFERVPFERSSCYKLKKN